MSIRKIGIDFGSCTIKYCLYGTGQVYTEPCVAAVDVFDGRILAYGERASVLFGRSAPGSVRVIRALQDGVIVNYALARYMISDIVERICGGSMMRPVLAASISSGITGLEKKTMLDCLYDAGASRAYLMEEPVAAAFGANLDKDEPHGIAVLDIGGGSSDCAVITMNSVAISRSIPTAGDYMTKEIIKYMREARSIEIGFHTAEELKKILANAVMRTEEISMVAGGKQLSGEAVNFEVNSTEMRFILKSCYEDIEELVRNVFDQTSPELLGDIAAEGLILTGGSASIYGLSDYLSHVLQIPVTIPENPGQCVARGVARALPKAASLAAMGFLYTN